MATAYHTQPAAANYYSPSSSHHKERGYRLCDTCGTAETPATGRFRLCGGCMATQYCSQDCQRADWASHKAVCQHTASTMSAAKQHTVSGISDENIAKYLRKFTSSHQDLLSWAGFQALQLKRCPANVRQQALLIELNFQNSSDSMRRFTVKGTHIVPKTYVTGSDPLVAADIQRRDERSRRSGGIGTALIIIQCGALNQVMPVEVDAPNKISWDDRNDWAEVLHHFVHSGRTDFKPISTTPRGTYYG
ncbi:hypothetical protein NEOLEDRAFT_1136570 [Neolentinus lepideus HHB14362 ss-1]|uniref:MYND-type domain-containing protein n=1 Tax=Neolentinus lepideus HHB14362 ss-1 TaxID=1314782 RepID=A0A165R3U2_9AGAM|nr:hypothetical protein NEOLEDRAFT_1136570 [Neolentinus lepideus HHB14362 ss-1]